MGQLLPVLSSAHSGSRPPRLAFKPKMVCIGRAALFYTDIAAWGGDLPWGVGTEIWWDPSFKDSPGIGGTTPDVPRRAMDQRNQTAPKPGHRPWLSPPCRSLQTPSKGPATLDPEKVNAALAQTDLLTIRHRVKFDENHFSRGPLMFGQWFKTDKPEKWELKVVFSKHDFVPATGQPIFPKPYK